MMVLLSSANETFYSRFQNSSAYGPYSIDVKKRLGDKFGVDVNSSQADP